MERRLFRKTTAQCCCPMNSPKALRTSPTRDLPTIRPTSETWFLPPDDPRCRRVTREKPPREGADSMFPNQPRRTPLVDSNATCFIIAPDDVLIHSCWSKHKLYCYQVRQHSQP